MKKYFYENKKRNLYFESEDRYEVVEKILEKGCFSMDFAETVVENEVQLEIVEILAEKFVEEVEE